MDENKIDQILIQEWCDRHGVPQGVPCWWIHSGVVFGKVTPAICGNRAEKAGFIGHITDKSKRVVRR